MIRSMIAALVCAMALTTAVTPAAARDWAPVAGWDITEGDDFCMMSSEYEGPGESLFGVLLNDEGRVVVFDVNYDWTAKQGTLYPDISFVIGDKVYSGDAGGFENAGRSGFVVRFGQEVLPEIAKAKVVHIFKGKQRIDRLDLEGSGAALETTKRCIAQLRVRLAAERERERRVAAAEAREKARFADLPKNPFED